MTGWVIVVFSHVTRGRVKEKLEVFVVVLVQLSLVLLHPGLQHRSKLISVESLRVERDLKLFSLHWVLLVAFVLFGDVDVARHVFSHLERSCLTDNQVGGSPTGGLLPVPAIAVIEVAVL